MFCKNCGFNFEGNFCPNCGLPSKEVVVNSENDNSESNPNKVNLDDKPNLTKKKKAIYKKWWFYLIIAIILCLGIFCALEIINNTNSNQSSRVASPNVVVTEAASKMVSAYCYASYADVQYAEAQNVYCTSLGNNQYKVTGKAYVYDKYGDHYYGKFTAIYKYENEEAIKISLDVDTPRLEN